MRTIKMAAEKLTKRRLAQILLMMVILVIVFSWRSVTYSNKNVLCDHEQDCTIQVEDVTVTFKWRKASETYSILTVPIEQNLAFELINSNVEKNISIHNKLVPRIERFPVRIKISQFDKGRIETIKYVTFR